MKNIFNVIAIGLMCGSGLCASASDQEAVAQRMNRYNVVWNTPSKDASGAMPIGNGDVSAVVYAIENGDLYLLMGKNDAYTYQGDIFKTGRVKISMAPNPFVTGKPFRQTLDLATGSILIEADGVKLRIWADANRNVCHVEIDAPQELAVTARPDPWKRMDHTPYNQIKDRNNGFSDEQIKAIKGPLPVAQDVSLERGGKMLSYFAVGDRSVYPYELKFYNFENMASKVPDPYRFNTFGNLLESPQLILANGALTGKGKNFDIQIHSLTMQTPDPEKWTKAIEDLAAKPVDVAKDWAEHAKWWTAFWDRGWIIASDNGLPADQREKLSGEAGPAQPTHYAAHGATRYEPDGAAVVAQTYNVFRYHMASQSRGKVQVKFNGGIFTQQLRKNPADKPSYIRYNDSTKLPDGWELSHEDDRLWGRRFTFQNQRHLYWPLLMSGDFDLMKPFFDYYRDMLEARTAICKAWFGHDGAYFRENISPIGGELDCSEPIPPKVKRGEDYKGSPCCFHFNSGLEATAMMIDYVNYTGDTDFRDRVLVPFARETLLFFDKHFEHENGKLVLQPYNAAESWWHTINPTPDVAGLRFCLGELLAMKAGTADDQQRWQRFVKEIPEIPLREIDGKLAISPAEKIFDKDRLNAENAEGYALFPYRCYGLALGNNEVAEWTAGHPTVWFEGCWQITDTLQAVTGRAANAVRSATVRARIASSACRFPLYGKEICDSCPDFDQLGSGSTALQRMLVQEVSGSGPQPGKILLLPAWPTRWDVDFKLHLMHNTVITGTVKNGKLEKWDIQPDSRRKDVVVCDPQEVTSKSWKETKGFTPGPEFW